MRRSVLLLAAYLLCRAALGAALNPLYNGPDEAAHVEYIRAVARDPAAPPTGVERRQLPAYYLLAAVPWRLAAGETEAARLFAVRLLSGLCGTATLVIIWRAARLAWPEHAEPALVAASMVLTPGHLFLLASASNDPLATALASLSFLAGLRLWLGAPKSQAPGWVILWVGSSAAALIVKPTALPVIAGAAAAFAFRARHRLWGTQITRVAILLSGAAAVAVNLYVAAQEPTSGALPALARFWPLAVLRAPVAYITDGGIVESFRTWWYAYDYLVRWPYAVEWALVTTGLIATLLALAGLVLASRGGSGSPSGRLAAPGIAWWCGAAQVAFVLGRFGLGDVLQIEMGGAAQAKAFFTGLAPLALLWAAGISTIALRLRVPHEFLVRSALVCLVALDGVSLAITTWQHYRWWQVGI